MRRVCKLVRHGRLPRRRTVAVSTPDRLSSLPRCAARLPWFRVRRVCQACGCPRSFTLCLRAAGLEARHVTDWADHVWSEFWSAAQGRWVHLDPCEGAFDKPLLYEVLLHPLPRPRAPAPATARGGAPWRSPWRLCGVPEGAARTGAREWAGYNRKPSCARAQAGWGKPPAYVLAAAATGVADVTGRYTADPERALARRALCPEAELAAAVARVTARARAGLAPGDVARLAARDRAERAELAARARRGAGGAEPAGLPGAPGRCPFAANARRAPCAAPAGGGAPQSVRCRPALTWEPGCPGAGRQTGSAEWVAARGEGGASARAAAPPTRYRPARDAGRAASAAGGARLSSGYVRASGENAPAETAAKARSGPGRAERPAACTPGCACPMPWRGQLWGLGSCGARRRRARRRREQRAGLRRRPGHQVAGLWRGRRRHGVAGVPAAAGRAGRARAELRADVRRRRARARPARLGARGPGR